MGFHRVAIVYVLFPLVAAAAPTQITIADFGAKGDGVTLNTKSIQAAIDTSARAGGGTVHFPAGTFVSGTIQLRDHVRLELDAGAVLLASGDIDDYPFIVCRFPSCADRYNGRALIWGEGLTDIAITGRGTIEGDGARFRDKVASEEQMKLMTAAYAGTGRYAPVAGYANRPYLIRLVSCRNVLVENITLRNSPMWMQHYLDCDFVTLRGVNVFNHGGHNNDMVDIDCCRDVVVTGCFGDTDDDALTLKSTGARPTERVVISDCVLRSHCNAIKAGTESSGGFKDITISNCVVTRSTVDGVLNGQRNGIAGIALEIVDGGTLDGVAISNVTIEGTASPIFMRLGNRARSVTQDGAKPAVGTFQNVSISNLVARDVGSTGCAIAGIPGHPIENVSISNVRITFPGGGTKEQALANVPELEDKYPEVTMFGPLPAYGFFCRHVEGLTLDNVQMGLSESDQRPALLCEDVRRLKLNGFTPANAAKAVAPLRLLNTQDAYITGCWSPTVDTFLKLETGCERITLTSNDLTRARKTLLMDETCRRVKMSARQ